SRLSTREILEDCSREEQLPSTVSVNGGNGARIRLARERAQTYKSSHGANHSYRGNSVVSGSVPDGRVWIWLPVARHPGHSSHHHIDPVFARSLVERAIESTVGNLRSRPSSRACSVLANRDRICHHRQHAFSLAADPTGRRK